MTRPSWTTRNAPWSRPQNGASSG